MRVILISIVLCANNLFAQTNPALSLDLERSEKNKRLNSLILMELGTYSLSILGFNELWYKNYDKSSFHFINDNSNWLQMDKMGHVATSYHSGVNGIKLYKWTGINKNKAIRGILEPLTTRQNIINLKKAGFKNNQIIHQDINFIGILSIK